MLKILIAVDGSEHANRAIDAVAELARNSAQLETVLLCVSPEPIFYGNYTASTIQKIEEDQNQQQTTILADAQEHAKSQGLKVLQCVGAYGVIANEIVRAAEQHKVSQIAMGTRGMGAVGAMFLGSVAQRVIHQSPVPVLLAR
jgi:nucleotide-binding universal stress UspA family protein